MGLVMYLNRRIERGDECYWGYAYDWGKSGQFFKWFQKNVCDGDFDQDYVYDVSREQLKSLLSDCEKVLADPSVASEVLPTVNGHGILGSCEYDHLYFWDIERTANCLRAVLEEDERYGDAVTYELEASW